MKKLRKMKMSVLTTFSVIMMIFVLSPIGHASDTATRGENIQKIESFLADKAVTESLMEKGVSSEKILGQLDSMSDAQLEKFAENADLQVGGALDDDPAADFFTFYKWYLIGILAATVLMFVLI